VDAFVHAFCSQPVEKRAFYPSGAFSMTRPEPLYLNIDKDGPQRRIACLVTPGTGPVVVWLGGFKSDMRATKAESLARWAEKSGRAMIRFDYAGHGESTGDFSEMTISTWLADALAVIARFGGSAPVIVGSSMGGWIALLAARARRASNQSVSALVLIAPATDFTEILMWERFPEEIRNEITLKGMWMRASEYSPEPYPITLQLIVDGRKNLLFGHPIDPVCPTHILQGMCDPDVPWQHAMTLLEHLPSTSTMLTLIKDGDHRLSREQDIALLLRSVEAATGDLT
jgi:pimeloyl-ACP methyl ester carboxylesterase